VAAATSRPANIPAFFESLASRSFQRFEPHTFFVNGNKVFVLVAFDVTHVASGKQYTFPYEGHLWTSMMPARPSSSST
jgi:hypothetical protein